MGPREAPSSGASIAISVPSLTFFVCVAVDAAVVQVDDDARFQRS
jgi:hypothetical protein